MVSPPPVSPCPGLDHSCPGSRPLSGRSHLSTVAKAPGRRQGSREAARERPDPPCPPSGTYPRARACARVLSLSDIAADFCVPCSLSGGVIAASSALLSRRWAITGSRPGWGCSSVAFRPCSACVLLRLGRDRSSLLVGSNVGPTGTGRGPGWATRERGIQWGAPTFRGPHPLRYRGEGRGSAP